MTDFCDFIPDAEQCQVVEPVEPDSPTTGGGASTGSEGNGEHGEHEMEGDPMMGNLTYLMVPLMGAISGALELFRYHDETHYDNGDVLGTNIWKYAGEASHYTHFGIAIVLTITQLLSMFGIAGEINIMAWMYLEMFEMVFNLIVRLVNMYVKEKAYSIS